MHVRKQVANNTLLVLFLSIVIDLIGLGLVLPLLPFYGQSFGASTSTITLLFSVYALVNFVTTPFWGNLSDRIGRRPLLLLSLAGSGVAYMWFGFTHSLMVLFLARALAGAMGYSMVIAQAYVSDITTPENRSQGMGILGAAFGLGFTLGPALSGVLVGLGGDEPNLRLPLFVAAGLSFMAFLWAWYMLPESKPRGAWRDRSPADPGRHSLTARIAKPWQILKQNSVATFMISLSFWLRFGWFGSQTILALWLNHVWHWEAQHVGYVFLLLGFVAVVVQGGLVGPVTRQLGEINMLFLGLSFTVLAFICFLVAGNLYVLLLSLVLLSAGESFCRPALSSVLSQVIDQEYQGTVLGMAQSSMALASILAPVTAGVLFEHISPAMPFIGSACLVGTQLIVALIYFKRTGLSDSLYRQHQQRSVRSL